MRVIDEIEVLLIQVETEFGDPSSLELIGESFIGIIEEGETGAPEDDARYCYFMTKAELESWDRSTPLYDNVFARQICFDHSPALLTGEGTTPGNK